LLLVLFNETCNRLVQQLHFGPYCLRPLSLHQQRGLLVKILKGTATVGVADSKRNYTVGQTHLSATNVLEIVGMSNAPNATID